MNKRGALLAFVLCMTAASSWGRGERSRTFNVRDYGAAGDGQTLDTGGLNKTIEACAAAGGGRVRVPPGKYLTGTVHLKSNLTIALDAGAELIGTADPDQYHHFTPPRGTPLVGGSLRWHRAMILGDGVENVTITGRGVINGNSVFDKLGEEGIRGPHAVLLGNSRNVAIRDVSIRNAGNYAVLLEFTSGAIVRGVTITGGYDGVHMRGWIDRPCRDVSVIDCEFYTGDDCIAGWYWEDTLIDRCVLNSACNGIRLFGPAKHTIVHGCLFFGPARYAWRTSGILQLKNMAAGVCIQPSAWGETPGSVDNVHVCDVVMRDVATPLHVAAKSPSTIGHVTIDGLSANRVYRAAASFESWAAEPIGRIDLRYSRMRFVGGSAPVWSDPMGAGLALLRARSSADVRPPGESSRPLPAWGLYARHVASLNLADVQLGIDKQDARPALILDRIDALEIDGLRWPRETRRPMVLRHVKQITQPGPSTLPSVPLVEATCLGLSVSPGRRTITATVRSVHEGLARIELKLDGDVITRWAWLSAGERADVVFADLPLFQRGASRDVVCGSVRTKLAAAEREPAATD